MWVSTYKWELLLVWEFWNVFIYYHTNLYKWGGLCIFPPKSAKLYASLCYYMKNSFAI